jgi:hypothetical protein
MKQLRPTAPDNPFKTLFANSAFANGPLASLTGALDSIPLDYEYPFTQYPPGLKIEGSTEYVLKRARATTATPDEFRSRAIGVIPMADLNRLVSLLEAFAPAYDSLVYLPNRATFERQLRDIDALVTSKDLGRTSSGCAPSSGRVGTHPFRFASSSTRCQSPGASTPLRMATSANARCPNSSWVRR